MDFRDYIFAKKSQLSGDYNDGYYDAFWDAFQDYGKRENYASCFNGYWTEETFRPKYDLVVRGVANNNYSMFTGFSIKDLENQLDNCGVRLDTKDVTSFGQMFYSSRVVTIPEIDASQAGGFTGYTFGECLFLKTIRKIILKNDGSQSFASTTFSNDRSLENLIFEGTIGQNGLNVQWCPLSVESLMSIINCLQDKRDDVSGTEWVVTIGTNNIAKLTEEALKMATDKGWRVE